MVIKSQTAFEDLELEAESTVLTHIRCAWLGTSPSVDAGISELCQCLMQACFQSIEMLLNMESSAGSILNMLKSRRFRQHLVIVHS